MPRNAAVDLSRRERQIMDVIYQRGRASAADVQADLPDPPSYSAVRALLAILVSKGALKVDSDGPRYVYRPTRPRAQAGRSAIHRVVETFFEGSIEKAVAALLESNASQISDAEIASLERLIQQARQEGK